MAVLPKPNRMQNWAIALCIVFGSGCASSPTKSDGSAHTQLSEDTFRVDYKGNGFTSVEKARDFALLQASELCLSKGFSKFAVIGDDTGTQSSWVNAFGKKPGKFNFQDPHSTLLIKCYKEGQPHGNDQLYDPAIITQSIKARYQLK